MRGEGGFSTLSTPRDERRDVVDDDGVDWMREVSGRGVETRARDKAQRGRLGAEFLGKTHMAGRGHVGDYSPALTSYGGEK